MPRIAGQDIRSTGLRSRATAGAGLALACLLAGCSLDYTSVEVAELASSSIPDTVAVGVVHKVHQDGHLAFQLVASKAETYNSSRRTVLTDASFKEFDAAGAPATEGTAGRVVFHSDTQDAEISGGVLVHSAAEKGGVTAQSLSWVNTTRMLSAPEGETVTLNKDDGSSISGTGFSGDFRQRQVSFSGPVQGTYVWQPQ
jgi:LPS export ABC transporter protein LptC